MDPTLTTVSEQSEERPIFDLVGSMHALKVCFMEVSSLGNVELLKILPQMYEGNKV